MRRGVALATAQFRLDLLRQLLAQLDAPLIVRVNVPNNALKVRH